jgi:hypothetical protein
VITLEADGTKKKLPKRSLQEETPNRKSRQNSGMSKETPEQ